MTKIRSELLNDKNLSMWLATIAILAFAAGYGLASVRHMDSGSQVQVTDLAMGKYGHQTHRP